MRLDTRAPTPVTVVEGVRLVVGASSVVLSAHGLLSVEQVALTHVVAKASGALALIFGAIDRSIAISRLHLVIFNALSWLLLLNNWTMGGAMAILRNNSVTSSLLTSDWHGWGLLSRPGSLGLGQGLHKF